MKINIIYYFQKILNKYYQISSFLNQSRRIEPERIIQIDKLSKMVAVLETNGISVLSTYLNKCKVYFYNSFIYIKGFLLYFINE